VEPRPPIWYAFYLENLLLTKSEIASIYWLLWCFITILMDVVATLKVAQDEKNLEILMLRQQVRILQRKLPSSPRISKPEKLILNAIASQMKQTTLGFRKRRQRSLLLFEPDALLKGNRELVKRK
jgi:hypothetical protein